MHSIHPVKFNDSTIKCLEMRAKITEECHKLMRYSFIFSPIFENRTIFQPFQKEDQFATNIKIKISQSHQNFATCHSNKPSGQFNKLTLNYNHYQTPCIFKIDMHYLF